MGPHPAVATVRRAVRSALAALDGAGEADRPLLVACSGGADSVALAAAVAFEADRAGRRHGLVTVDHGLQRGSDERARTVAALGWELGFDPVEVVAVRVPDGPGAGGPEAAARAARYPALDGVAEALGGAAVLLGHTADDQAETVLLGLGRGSGPASLAGMRPMTGGHLRPFLTLRRAQTRAACEALGLPIWDDPHNADPRYRRVRIRLEALPLLEEILAGGVTEALGRTAAQLAEAEDALAELASRELALRELPGGGLSVDGLEVEPRAIRTRVLKRWAQEHGAGALTSVHVEALDELVTGWRGQGPIDLPDGCRVRRTSGRLESIAPTRRPRDP